jgi:hypothetical protein
VPSCPPASHVPTIPELAQQLRRVLEDLRQIEERMNGTPAQLDGNPAGPPLGASRVQTTLPPRERSAVVPSAQALSETPTLQAQLPDDVRVPGYEVLGELGRGGMGVVYKARQVGLGRIVSLKMILTGGLAAPAELARFQSEAMAIARLRHPNIVQIHEVGEYQGKPFFSLEFCDGGSLDKELAGNPLPAQAAAALVQPLARAMQAAHEAHVVHRDLKPANVLLAAYGFAQEGSAKPQAAEWVPKITDFGLAKKLDEAGQTQTGAIMGTPSYMAPEQAEARKDIGPAADVYALGAILYECLTGRPPFRAATALDTILQVLEEEPVPPRRLNAQVPLDLETITLKCLEKEPSRYASSLALADDLGRFLVGEPVCARPVGMIERGWRWARRNPAVAGLTTAVALALLAGTLVASLLAAWALGERGRANEAALEKGRQTDRAEAKAREAADNARPAVENARVAGQREKEAAGNARLARQREKQAADNATLAGQREKEAARNATLAAQREKDALDQKKQADEQRDRAELLVYASKLAQAQLLWKDEKPAEALRLLDECQWNLRGWEHRHLWTLYDSNQITLRGHTSGVNSVAWSADGTRIVSGGWDMMVKVLDVEKVQELLSLKGHTGYASSVAWSPDGKWISSRDGSGKALTWDATTGQLLPHARPIPTRMEFDVISPDGSRRAFIENGQIRVVFLRDFAETHRRRQAQDRAFLERLARPDPQYHRRHADQYEKSGDLFAAAFHLRRLLLIEANDDVRKRLVAIESQLTAQAKRDAALPQNPPAKMPYAQ